MRRFHVDCTRVDSWEQQGSASKFLWNAAAESTVFEDGSCHAKDSLIPTRRVIFVRRARKRGHIRAVILRRWWCQPGVVEEIDPVLGEGRR